MCSADGRRALSTARLHRQAGSYLVEFSLILLVFLSTMYAIVEMSRVVYLFNTLQEVTRMAARELATRDFSDEGLKSQVLQSVMMRSGGAGNLVLGDPVSPNHLQVDYLALTRVGTATPTLTRIPSASLPMCPAQNRFNCELDPNAANCIRFVRVRVCQPGPGDPDTCAPVHYQPLLPLTDLAATLPVAQSIVVAESLGYEPGMALCP